MGKKKNNIFALGTVSYSQHNCTCIFKHLTIHTFKVFRKENSHFSSRLLLVIKEANRKTSVLFLLASLLLILAVGSK